MAEHHFIISSTAVSDNQPFYLLANVAHDTTPSLSSSTTTTSSSGRLPITNMIANVLGKKSKANTGSVSRKLLLPWLVEHLDKGTFVGVHWYNRSDGSFILPWKHGKNKEFSADLDVEIFKEWAINTGRYKPYEAGQYKVWKATFRNALHKHPDIREMKELAKQGQFRAYRITVPADSVFDAHSRGTVKRSQQSSSSSNSHGGGPLLSPNKAAGSLPWKQDGPPTMCSPQPFSSSASDSVSSPATPSTPGTVVPSPTGSNQPGPSPPSGQPGPSPPGPLTPSTVGPSTVGPSTPATVLSPSGSTWEYRSPQDLRSADSLFSPLSNVSTALSSENEYPSELEMSPGSSVATYVDVGGGAASGGGTFDKQHIRSASGTVYNQDIDEILKQVSLPIPDNGGTVPEPPTSTTTTAPLHGYTTGETIMRPESMLSDPATYTRQGPPAPSEKSMFGAAMNQPEQQTKQPAPQEPFPMLNPRQNQMLQELKKLRQELRETRTERSSGPAPVIDDIPIQELLNTPNMPDPVKSRKRPRLENSDLQAKDTPEDYLCVLARLGLPKKNSPSSMAITVYYKTVGVAAYGINNPEGARLYYCPNKRVQMSDEFSNELYGPQAATQVCMPLSHNSTPTATQTLLNTLTRGVVLQEDGGDIFATRLCACAVFFGDKRGFLTKLERGQRVKIFDFKQRFLPLFFQYLRVQSGGDQEVLLDPFPEPEVMLSFGQRWGDKRPIENTLIWAKVIHLKARQLVLDFTELYPPLTNSSNEDGIQFSTSDDFDRLADAFSVAM